MTKRLEAALAKIDTQTSYDVNDAIKLVFETASAKFKKNKESVDVAINLGIIPAKENVRGLVNYPTVPVRQSASLCLQTMIRPKL